MLTFKTSIITLVVGMILGYLGQRSRFCTISGVRDFYLMRDSYRLKGFLGIIVGGIIGFGAVNIFNGKLQDFLHPGSFEVMPILADGFYLVGTFNNVDAWNLSDLTADKLFTATDVEGQYSIDVTLTAGDRFKAIKVENEALIQWYPTGSDNDYVVDASHAGQKTIYFRPDFWQDWNGHFYVEPNQGEGINNVEVVEAVKVLRDGQILIIKGNKTFNVQGQLVK